MSGMEIGGTYPMLYAFFGEDGALRRDTRCGGHRSSSSGVSVTGKGWVSVTVCPGPISWTTW